MNPGSQTARIGSFHPITEGDWAESAYITASGDEFFQAINDDDVAFVTKRIEEGADVNGN